MPTARWERIGRAAGVVREADWDTPPRRATPPSVAGSDAGTPRPTADAADELLAFVTELRAALGDPAELRPWAAWVAWSKERLERLVRAARPRPPRRRRARWRGSRPRRVLDRLAPPRRASARPVTRAEFRATFVAELDITPGRQGKVGDGVHVSTLAGAAGLDVDVAVVARRRRRPASRRRRSSTRCSATTSAQLAGLEGSDERAARVHRQFLAAVAHDAGRVSSPCPAATCGPRPTRHRVALDRASSLDRAGGRRPRVVDSHAHGLAATEFPVSPAEHRVRELWTRVRAGDDVRDLPAPPATIGPAAGAARCATPGPATHFTEYDGDLVEPRRRSPIGRPSSPTRIETWAALPARLLRALRARRPPDRRARRPSRRWRRSTAARRSTPPSTGCTSDVLDGTLAAPGPDGWTDVHAAALRRAGEEVADDAARRRAHRPRGVLGQRAGRAARRARPVAGVRRGTAGTGGACAASEQRFGDDEPVELAPPGRPDDRVPRADRPRRRAARRHARRHRPQDGQRRRPRQAVGRRSDARRHPLPAPGLRRRGPCHARPPGRPGARRVHVLQARLQARRRRRSTTTSGSASAQDLAARRRRHRGRRVPGRAGAADAASTSSAAGTASPTGSARPVGGPSGSASATTRRWLAWFADADDDGGRPMAEQLRLAARRRPTPAPADVPPPDQAGPRPHPHRHGATLFVEAGAGAGKTTALVGRILTLVDEGVPIDDDRRHHVHREGGRRAAPPPPRAARRVAGRRRGAGRRSTRLDHAPIGTLHAFARRHPVRVPGRGRPAARLRRARRAGEPAGARRALGGPPRRAARRRRPRGRPRTARRPSSSSSARGRRSAGRTGLRRIVEDFQANWDLVDAARRARRRRRARPRCDPRARRGSPSVVADAGARPTTARPSCSPSSPRLADADRRTTATSARCSPASRRSASASARPGEHGQQGELARPRRRRRPRRPARPRSWRSPTLVDEHLQAWRELPPARRRRDRRALRARRRPRAGAPPARSSSTTCSCSPAACWRPTTGARRRLHQRYQRVLLDEFQDTDPIQLEIAVRLTARARPTSRADPAAPAPAARPAVRRRRPEAVDLPLPPGRHRRVPRPPPIRSAPTARCCRPTSARRRAVIDWVNGVFADVIQPEPDVQPAYGPLDACRPGPRDHGSVHVLGADVHDGDDVDAQALREREADVGRRRRRHRPARGLAGRRRRRRAAPVPARRHRRAAAGPHVAADARAGARRPRRAVPGRERVGRLRGAGDPPPAAGAARRRRPDRRAGARRRAAHAAVRLQRRRAATTGAPAGGRWNLFADAARRRWPTIRSAEAIAHVRSIAARRRPVDAGRAARPHRRASGACSRRRSPGRTPATCGGGCATSSTRPGRGPTPAAAGVRRYLRWAALPGRRGPGQRHDPARARPRRRARHDRPRRQGPGVPDHGRQRADHASRRARRAMSVVWPGRRRGRWPSATARCSRRSSRSTSRWATPSAAGCCTSPAPGPSTTSSCRCTASRRTSPTARPRPPSATVLAEAGAAGHGAGADRRCRRAARA